MILSGFGTEDTHHIVHTLRWGPDGMLYFNQSVYIHSHIETPHGVRRLNARRRLAIPAGNAAIGGVFPRPGGIPGAMHFDRWGQSFVTDGAGGEGINYAFPGAMFAKLPARRAFCKASIPAARRIAVWKSSAAGNCQRNGAAISSPMISVPIASAAYV